MASPRKPKQHVNARNIPTRIVRINDENPLPDDYSSTPGGTLFSTTPGGTRIIYDRGFLLQMRGSPLTRTPPKNLPYIPGVTGKVVDDIKENKQPAPALEPIRETVAKSDSISNGKPDGGEEPQFSIEM